MTWGVCAPGLLRHRVPLVDKAVCQHPVSPDLEGLPNLENLPHLVLSFDLLTMAVFDNWQTGESRYFTRRHLDIMGDITQSTFWKTYWYYCQYYRSLQWRHNGRDGVSNHQPHYCLLNRLFRLRTKKTSNRWLANSPHKGPVTRKMFPFDDVIMCPGFLRHKPKID